MKTPATNVGLHPLKRATTTKAVAKGRILLLIAILSLNYFEARADELVQSFAIKEFFGVSHPNQIIDFDFTRTVDWAKAYMIGPAGNEVPNQVLQGGKIAVQTDLPANAEKTWKLMSGRTSAPFNGGVQVIEKDTYYEITNGLTGVRVTKPAQDLRFPPAPVQGIRYRDGTWTATGQNTLGFPPSGSPNKPTVATNLTVRFLEKGPLKVIMEVSYGLWRDRFNYGVDLAPSGPGFYKSTIEVQAGQPSILFEEDADTEVTWSLNIYDGLAPTQGRYRGHHSTAKEFGYEADGRQYRQEHERPAMDAFVDFNYDQAVRIDTYTSSTSRRPMAVWDPWIYDGGRYWQLYSSNAPPTANLLGTFAGRASRAIGCAYNGVGIFTGSAGVAGRSAGIGLRMERRTPDARFFQRMLFGWGLFVGVKGDDLKDPYEVQPIARQMSLHGGINLNKIHRYDLTFPDPPRGYGALFMDRSVLQSMIQKLRQDKSGPSGDGYYHYLYTAEPSARDLIDMWADPSGSKIKAAVDDVFGLARDILDALVNRGGERYGYWAAALEMNQRGLTLDSVLANDQTTPQDRAKVKASAVAFAKILWDDDFVPMAYDLHGLNMGTENMLVSYIGYRNSFALLLADHPAMVNRAAEVEGLTLQTIASKVNEFGAEIGSTHYISASFAPTLNLLLQIRMLGRSDPFATEPKLGKFAEFYMNFLTPPEVRFGGTRKLVCFGDSSTASSQIYGALATGFRTAQPELSARLMGAWRADGKTHSGFFGTTLLMIDEEAPYKNPLLSSATFPGWYSVLRHGWGSPNETAIWFVNGDFYRDHRHDDYGSVVMYALGAPLSIDWGPLYNPHVPSALMHSMVMPESLYPQPWNQDNLPVDQGWSHWIKSTQETFKSFQASAHASANFASDQGLVWTRSTYSIHPNEEYPIFLITDSFAGTNANASKVFTLNLMANGSVETPIGPITPKLNSYYTRSHIYTEGPLPQDGPSAGTVFSLSPGVSRLGFTGQWLIDWDVYEISSSGAQAQIGNWGHNWHPATEMAEFISANKRPFFEERQHILRIKGNGAFKTLILPYHKGRKRNDLRVTQDGERIIIATASETSLVADAYYAYTNVQKQALATFSNQSAEAYGLSVAGGPTEIVMEPAKATITAHGTKGLRRLKIPGDWAAVAPLSFQNGEFQLDYQVDAPVQVVLIKGTPESVPMGADSFAGRVLMSGTRFTVRALNAGASKETGEPNHAGFRGGKSVWWSWTAPANGLVKISTRGSSFDTLLAVYTGSVVSAITLVVSNDDADSTTDASEVTFKAVAGTSYQIAVDSFNGGYGHDLARFGAGGRS